MILIQVILITLFALGFVLLIGSILPDKHRQINKLTEPCVDDNDEAELIYQKYRSVHLLTKTELRFYQDLVLYLPSSVSINCKVRLADLIMPRKGIPSWRSAFSKVCSKHVNFVITDKATAEVICLVELDDTSHQKPDRMARDEFVDGLCVATGYSMIHIIVASHYDFATIFKDIPPLEVK